MSRCAVTCLSVSLPNLRERVYRSCRVKLAPCFVFHIGEQNVASLLLNGQAGRCVRAGLVSCMTLLWGAQALAGGPDPLASNNGIYPQPGEWTAPFRTVNLRYPDKPVPSGWLKMAPRKPITPATAEAYMVAIKKFVEPSLRKMIEAPHEWSPAAYGWYDMPWMASGDAENGRDPILGSFTGQVLLQQTFAQSGLKTDIQNHTVIYYDATAAGMLKKLWANLFRPDRTRVVFPEGSLIIKAGAVTATPQEWPILDGTAQWTVFRPDVDNVKQQRSQPNPQWQPKLLTLRALQFDIIVKDSVASPQTGWIFMTYIHDKNAPGTRPWDKLVPLGAQWGNDPEFARNPKGTDPQGGPLRQNWVNPKAPRYSQATLGWGGRLSGPIDVSERHDVMLTDGRVLKATSASSCMSCHGTAQYPFISNLYPSPNKAFPPEGTPFPMFVPGSADWARWFQNRPGTQPQDAYAGSVGLDYDMLIMFALGEVDAVMGTAAGMPRRAMMKVH